LIAAGFKGEDVRNTAEAALRDVGIQFSTSRNWLKPPGPFLKVKVDKDHENLI
jgi:hypothetical protein